MTSVNVSVKSQKLIAHVEKIIFGILVDVLASVTKIVRFVNTWKAFNDL